MPMPLADAAHLLRRAGFGGSAAQVDAYSRLDRTAAVDRLLDLSLAPADLPPPELGAGEEWRQLEALQQWWLDRMATTPTPVQEKLALFWHGHFATGADKVYDARYLYDQNRLFRAEALGDFRRLTQAMAVQPAMLLYLDNADNRVGSANENFARELMELFTLGLDQYTQADVTAAARAWTGYGVDRATRSFVFRPDRHDTGQKTFFGITRAWNGPGIIDEICTGTKQGVMARFMARKLFSFLAHTNPSAATVDGLAEAFVASGLSIRALVRAILLHEDFWSPAARTGLLRSPAEYVVTVLRASGLTAREANPQWWMEAMGQELFHPPNVSGWRPNAAFVSFSAWQARAAFARHVTWIAARRGVLTGSEQRTVPAAVQAALDLFSVDSPSSTTRSALERYVGAERAARGWAERVNLFTATALSPEVHAA